MSLLEDEDLEVLRKLLRALGSARSEFVVAGGQAARLLRLHPLARPPQWDALFTRDLDLATMDKGHRSSENVGEGFIREGFSPRMSGDDSPPLTRYVWGTSEIEVIIPDMPRRKSTGATVLVLGASAQKVTNLEPLLVEPVELQVPGVGQVRVPNPAAYILQKVLTLTDRRSLSKKGKDALYVHDALLLFNHGGRVHPEVVEQSGRVLATLTRSQLKRLNRNAGELGNPGTDFVAEAARQAAGRPGVHTAEVVALAIRLGLRELLGL